MSNQTNLIVQDDLDPSLRDQLQALSNTPADHPARAGQLLDIGAAFHACFSKSQKLTDLEQAHRYMAEALSLIAEDHPDRVYALHELGLILRTQCDLSGKITDLEQAIKYKQEALGIVPEDYPNRPTLLHSLAMALVAYFERLGGMENLERAIKHMQEAVDITPGGHPDKASWLDGLGITLRLHFQRLGERGSLEQAIKCHQKAVDATQDSDPDKPIMLNNLGLDLLLRFEKYAESKDLDEAMQYLLRAEHIARPGHSDRPTWLKHLTRAFKAHFSRTGDVEDLNQAIKCSEQAVAITAQAHPNKASLINTLGAAYQTRFERLAKMEDLELAVRYHQQALDITPAGHPKRSLSLDNLGSALRLRFHKLGEVEDLMQALRYKQEAVLLMPADHSDRATCLVNLGTLHIDHFEISGEIEDLDLCLKYRKEAVDITPQEHTLKALFIDGLASVLQTRFNRLGEMRDLEQALKWKQEAVEMTPQAHSDRAYLLNSLAVSYQAYFLRTEEMKALDQAISQFHAALEITPEGHPDRANRFNNLAISYQAHFQKTEDTRDLEQAMKYNKEAVDLTPVGNQNRARWLNGLAKAYEIHFHKLQCLKDLEEAMEYYREAVDITPDNHPHIVLWLHALGVSYLLHAGSLTDKGNYQAAHRDIAMALATWERCMDHQTGPPQTSCEAALSVGRLAYYLHQHQRAFEAFQRAIHLLPQTVWFGLQVEDQYFHIRKLTAPAQDAAGAAIKIGSFNTALEWLEQGRSLVWNRLLQLQTPLDALHGVQPELAKRLSHIADRLHMQTISGGSSTQTESSQQLYQDQSSLALEWEKLLKQARTLPGFEKFLLPKPVSDLNSAAHAGPVAVINASINQCDALILLPGAKQVIHLVLHSISYQEVLEMQARLQQILYLEGRAARQRMTHSEADKQMESILSILWNKVVKPILDKLGLQPSSIYSLPHITWCPTGPFMSLPIHAAGIYDGSQKDSKLSDFCISSYTPTLSALLTEPTPSYKDFKMLAVGMSDAPGLPPLNGVNKELENIQMSARNLDIHIMQGQEATVAAVQDALGRSTWAHFACHGTQNMEKPLSSGLVLSGAQHLKLSDIIQNNSSGPTKGLAFLSACQTATGTHDLADESVHLAAGMLLAGYRSVIATMWTIKDEYAPEVAADVYKELFKSAKPDHTQSAYALHKAVENLKKSHPGISYLSWVPYVHMGH
ncbi:TPR-like protein [Heliocybe sulcata]|uniref:TPR-like protein n=1 Tax=Heliocybe sulcata TaxID=5364 RepID=A0A5C3MSY1_9AGAM|nr:TPR-like protein [Heliocybe sulcata]